MLQLYFLSILCNGLAGFLFVYGDAFESRVSGDNPKVPPFKGGFRLVVGIITAITGLLKLLAPVRVPILGDLLPAAAGLVAGFMLMYGFYREHGSGAGAETKMDRVGSVFLQYKKQIGIACMVIAALHFLFPHALFL